MNRSLLGPGSPPGYGLTEGQRVDSQDSVAPAIAADEQ